MKTLRLLLAVLSVFTALPAGADHPTDLDHLLRQVREASSREAAVRKEREQRFLAGQADREKLLGEMREAVSRERARGESLKQRFESSEAELQALEADLALRTGNLGELFGTVRQAANDLHGTLRDSLVSAQYPGRAEWFDVLASARQLPSITELERIWLLIQQEIGESGRVARFHTDVTGADGIMHHTPVIRVGVFNAVSGGRYLQFLPDAGRLAELSRQPARRDRKLATALEESGEGYLPMVIDPSRGALLDLLVQAPTLEERIHQAGLIGYLIILLGAGGLLLGAWRLLHLGSVTRRVRQQLREPDAPSPHNPLGRVLLAVQDAQHNTTETIELQLDGAILRELPPLSRGQGLVKLLAATAPLLGLLGTVTGMIVTFQSISLFGTGDPKLMASGISQALMTTVLGLVVAVPLLFFHNLMAARSRALVQILDEQSAGIIASRREVPGD
jgi:biopolymer transport protein ExbB